MDRVEEQVSSENKTEDTLEDLNVKFTCGVCESTFLEEVQLKTHILTLHKNDSPSFLPVHKKGSEKCDICGKLISKGNLSRHQAY